MRKYTTISLLIISLLITFAFFVSEVQISNGEGDVDGDRFFTITHKTSKKIEISIGSITEWVSIDPIKSAVSISSSLLKMGELAIPEIFKLIAKVSKVYVSDLCEAFESMLPENNYDLTYGNASET